METVTKKEYFGESDTKARRRSNVSDKVANITASEIENGVTLEKLESLNVPVFRYGTQITIHGKLPGVESGYINGYKSLVKNNNGSIGVRYVAIDAEKKAIVSNACHLSKSNPVHVGNNSTGYYMQKRIDTRCTPESMERGRSFLKSIPDCFIGSKQLVKDAFGCLYIACDISAIPESGLWKLVSFVSGGEISSKSEYEKAVDDRRERREAEKVEREAERAKQAEEAEKRKAVLLAEYKAKGFTHYAGPKFDGLYLIKPNGSDWVHIKYIKYGSKFKRFYDYSSGIERIAFDGVKARLVPAGNAEGFRI